MTVVVLNKIDLVDADTVKEKMKELKSIGITAIPLSCATRQNMEQIWKLF